MFGFSTLQLGIIGGLLILLVIVFGMYKWEKSKLETEKQEHIALKLEFNNYVKASEQRVIDLKRSSEVGAARAAAIVAEAQAEATKQAKENERLIRENKILKSRTVSNELVRVLDNPTPSQPSNGAGEATGSVKEPTSHSVGSSTSVGEHTEEEIALVLTRNKQQFENMRNTIIAWQEWAKSVCEIAGCE